PRWASRPAISASVASISSRRVPANKTFSLPSATSTSFSATARSFRTWARSSAKIVLSSAWASSTSRSLIATRSSTSSICFSETGDQIALSDEIPLIHLDFLDDPFDLGSHVCVLDGQDREAPCDPQLHPDQNDTRQKKDEQDETRRPPVYRREALSLRKDLFE